MDFCKENKNGTLYGCKDPKKFQKFIEGREQNIFYIDYHKKFLTPGIT